MAWSGVPNSDQLLSKYWSHGTEQRFLKALSSRTWSLLEWRRFANSLSTRWRSRAGRQNGRWHVNITSYKKDFYGRFATSPLCRTIKPRMPYQSSRERNKCVLTAARLPACCTSADVNTELVNKPHTFRLTQHRFISFKLLTFTRML